MACSAASAGVQQDMAAMRRSAEGLLCERFVRAQAEGDLPATVNPGDLARFIQAVTQGMAVLAASGTTGEELARVGDLAMKAWPR